MTIIIKKLFVIAGIIFLFNINTANSQEFAVINEIITMTTSPPGFYFWWSPHAGGTTNWLSPYNYRDGQFYFRFEVINQPTDELFYMSFDIWGECPNWADSLCHNAEQASDISAPLGGTGSIATFNSSPSNWYTTYGGVNFSNTETFERWGVVLWASKGPNILLSDYPNWSKDSRSDEYWAENYKWIPLTVRVTIVAVAQGHTFSGWGDYVGIKPPTPDYSIDYQNEQTSQAVPLTDEWSTNFDMSGATSGAGTKINVMPGTDLYFRTKAEGDNPASDIQHLDVHDRPEISTTAGDTSSTSPIPVFFALPDGFTGFELNDLEIENAVAVNLQENRVDLIPATIGTVKAKIISNALDGGSFESNQISVYYYEEIVELIFDKNIHQTIFPNPLSNKLYIKSEGVNYKCAIYDMTGNLIFISENITDDLYEIDMSGFSEGIYMIKLIRSDVIFTYKVIKKRD